MSKLLCEVCEKEEAVGVASSACGPISHAYGKNCLAKNADVFSTIIDAIWCVNGPENCAKWMHNLNSYKDSKYISWEEIVSLYTQDNIQEILNKGVEEFYAE